MGKYYWVSFVREYSLTEKRFSETVTKTHPFEFIKENNARSEFHVENGGVLLKLVNWKEIDKYSFDLFLKD